MQLIVEGYTEQGARVDRETLDRCDLRWKHTADAHCFSIDERGRLTAISAGTGTVWVESADGRLCSQAVEVFVKE